MVNWFHEKIEKLPRLEGTTRQVKCAKQIRYSALFSLQRQGYIEGDETGLMDLPTDAGWWMDNRKRITSELLELLGLQPVPDYEFAACNGFE